MSTLSNHYCYYCQEQTKHVFLADLGDEYFAECKECQQVEDVLDFELI